MPPLLRYPVSAGARPCPGRSSPGLTAPRGLHLDTACAPALTWQLTRSRDNQDQPIEVSTLSGEPHIASGLVLMIPISAGTSGGMSIQSFKPGTARFAYLSAAFAVVAAVIALLLALVLRTEFGWVLFALWMLSAVCSLIVAVGAYHRAHSDEAASRESAGTSLSRSSRESSQGSACVPRWFCHLPKPTPFESRVREREVSNQVSNNRRRQRRTPRTLGGRCLPAQPRPGPGSRIADWLRRKRPPRRAEVESADVASPLRNCEDQALIPQYCQGAARG